MCGIGVPGSLVRLGVSPESETQMTGEGTTERAYLSSKKGPLELKQAKRVEGELRLDSAARLARDKRSNVRTL